MSKRFDEYQRTLKAALAKTPEMLRAEDAARRAAIVAPVTVKKTDHGYGDCHYCGMPATDFGFFGEPVCDDCSH